jgi:P-type Cu+ transporter
VALSSLLSVDDSSLLLAIANVERFSDHPLASAIVSFVEAECVRTGADASNASTVVSHDTLPGKGVTALLSDGRLLRIGQPTWILEDTIAAGDVLVGQCQTAVDDMEESGATVVFASMDKEVVLAFAIADAVRREARSVVSWLRNARNAEVYMVSGDGHRAALAVADAVGIDKANVVSRALPSDKVDAVREAVGRAAALGSRGGGSVCFVGDGINDAGALAAADVGIALGSGTQIAAESAGIVLVKSRLEDVVIAMDVSSRAFRRMRWNYVWALGYNVIGIPIAAGALFPLMHRRLPPFLAAVAMGASSVSVVLSSLTLKLYTPPTVWAGRTVANENA